MSGKVVLGVCIELQAQRQLAVLERLRPSPTTDEIVYLSGSDNGTCARRRQLGWFVSGLPWGLEPHDIPIGKQWGG